jgi:acyl carrier protein
MIDVCRVVEDETGQSVEWDTRIDSLGLDSLDFLNLMVVCGVPDDKVAGLETVGDIADAIRG